MQLTFFIVTCRTKRVLAKNVSPIAWSYSPLSGTQCIHGIGHWSTCSTMSVNWSDISFICFDGHHWWHCGHKLIDTGIRRINQDLHIIRASQLHYTSLLDDARKTVEFIRKHKNPAMDSGKLTSEKELNDMFLERERDHLILDLDQGFRNAVVSFDKCDRSSMFSL